MKDVQIGLKKPTVKQQQALTYATAPGVRDILLDGAIRSGKTQVGVDILLKYALAAPCTYLVVRKTYRELEDSTKKALLHGDGPMPPMIPRELYRPEDYRSVDNKVTLRNGAEILFRSADSPLEFANKIRNINLGGFLIDQGEELDDEDYEDSYFTLLGRLSDHRGPRRGLVVSNPGPKDHWLYTRFYGDEELRTPPAKRTAVVRFELTDNKANLPADYVEDMLALEGGHKHDWFLRYIKGEWGSFGGKRFKVWNPDIHVCSPFTIPKAWEITEGIDYGFRAATACEWHAAAPDGHEYFVAEHYEAERTVSYHSKQIKATRKEHNLAASATWMDPSAWAQRGEFESPAFEFVDYGIFAAKAQNDRIGGWNRMDELLHATVETCTCPLRADGSPRLRLFEGRTPWLAKQIAGAKCKDRTDDIEKKNDHALDAGRYVLMSRPQFVDDDPEEELEEDADRVSRYVRRVNERADERDDDHEVLVMGG